MWSEKPMDRPDDLAKRHQMVAARNAKAEAMAQRQKAVDRG